MKDGLFAADADTADRGKPAASIRCKLLEMAAAPERHARNLLVYSDDADKASGNGWFDGDYGFRAYDARAANNFRYQAVLSWLATHPWVRVVTTDDLTDDDVVGELDLLRASDPYVEEHWRFDHVPPEPDHDNGLAYDTWYAAWARTRAAWLGETLRAISDRAEQAIERAERAPTPTRRRAGTARPLYFLMCLHESQWSKRPRIEPGQRGVRPRGELRRRRVAAAAQRPRVPRRARVGAVGRAAGPAGEHRDDGPVVGGRVAGGLGGRSAAALVARAEYAGLQWDHDPLPNVVLYNRECSWWSTATAGGSRTCSRWWAAARSR